MSCVWSGGERSEPKRKTQAKVRGEPDLRLQLVVDFHQGRKHLPVVTLKRVV